MFARPLSFLMIQTLACFSLPLSAAEARADAFVSLRAEATVEGRVLRLGDVATVTARDPADQAKCQALEVPRPASLAAPVKLSRNDIARQVAATYPEWTGRLIWGGSSEVVLTGKQQRVDLEPAINDAAAFLMEKLSGNDFVSLRLLERPSSIDVPAGTVRIRPDTQAARRSGIYVEVPVIVEVDGIQSAHPMLRFAVSRNPHSVNPAAEAIQGSVSATTSSATRNAPTETSDSSPYLVNRQQTVTLLVDSEGIRIESEGVALTNAREGERVRVRRANGNVELAGRAVKPGIVLLEEK